MTDRLIHVFVREEDADAICDCLMGFRVNGIRPRRWESKAHQSSVARSLVTSLVVVGLLALAVLALGHDWFGLS